jgi:hypothetical protein
MHTDKKLIAIIAASALFGGITGGGIGGALGSFHGGTHGGFGRHEGGMMMRGMYQNERHGGMMNAQSQNGMPANYGGIVNQAQNQGTTTK